MSNFDVEELEKAMNISIAEMSYEQQLKLAEEKSMREELQKKQMQEFFFEQEIKKAEELSQREAENKQSFYNRHFSSDPQDSYDSDSLNLDVTENNEPFDESVIFVEQFEIAQRRQEAQQRKPFDRDLRLAQQESARSEATNSGSDSDSGFASEERELEMALQKSCDPAEQYSREDQELMMALQISLKESSPVHSYRPVIDYLGSSQGMNDTDTLADIDPNDVILLSQLDKEPESSEKFSPLSSDEWALLMPFIEESKSENLVSSEVKTLDEIEAELSAASRRKTKKFRKTSNIENSSNSGSPVAHSETGTRPKAKRSASAFSVVKRQSPCSITQMVNPPKRGSPQSPMARKSPAYNQRMSSPPTAKLFNPVEKPFAGKLLDFSHSGATKKHASDNCNKYSTSGNGAYRPIIVDGCNVAFQHGKNDRFSAAGLEIIYRYFVNRYGYSRDNITIVCKHVTRRTLEDQAICERLYKEDVLIYTVSFLKTSPVFGLWGIVQKCMLF